jgi:hypothetical protein
MRYYITVFGLRNEALIGVWQWVKRGAETGTKGRDVRMGMAVQGGKRTFVAAANKFDSEPKPKIGTTATWIAARLRYCASHLMF